MQTSTSFWNYAPIKYFFIYADVEWAYKTQEKDFWDLGEVLFEANFVSLEGYSPANGHP